MRVSRGAVPQPVRRTLTIVSRFRHPVRINGLEKYEKNTKELDILTRRNSAIPTML